MDKNFTNYIYNEIVREILNGEGKKYYSFRIERAIKNKLLYSKNRFKYQNIIKINNNLDAQIPTEEIIKRLLDEKVISLENIVKTT